MAAGFGIVRRMTGLLAPDVPEFLASVVAGFSVVGVLSPVLATSLVGLAEDEAASTTDLAGGGDFFTFFSEEEDTVAFGAASAVGAGTTGRPP